ncbi:MAG: TlpA disulfide reductase family protein [Pirellulales bacterium]
MSKLLKIIRSGTAAAIVLGGSACALQAADVTQKFMASGLTEKMGGYRPIRAEMNAKPEVAKKPPAELTNPSYGEIGVGDKKFAFIIDQPEEGDSKFWVDTNADGDFTNDPATEWASRKQGEFTMYSGKAQLELGPEKLASIGVYRFDPKDPSRAPLKNTLMYFEDFGFEYEFELDGQKFSTFTAGAPKQGMRLPLDRDGNGQISMNYETVTLGKPFNFTGSTVILDIAEEKLVLKDSEEKLPQMPMPPDLRIGKPALEFAAETLTGDKVEFPKSFAGKLVMLDFWATWCGPCIGEIPNMKKAYADWHEDGFEILGVSFDQPEMKEKVEGFLKDRELPWAQIYEGKGWETTLGKQYDVSAIPFVLLVDGDSGEILATARQLRGEKLSEFIGEALKTKKEKK